MILHSQQTHLEHALSHGTLRTRAECVNFLPGNSAEQIPRILIHKALCLSNNKLPNVFRLAQKCVRRIRMASPLSAADLA
jgi:hypothetical protein